MVSTLNNIKSLLLGSLTVTGDDDLEMIGNLFPNLEDVDLGRPSGGVNGAGMITDLGLDLLASKLKALRKINLKGNYRITDQGDISLSENCSQLEEIVVKECGSVTKSGIAFVLQACNNLRSIGLHDLKLDKIHRPLSCASSLTEVDFSWMDVSVALLSSIVQANPPLKNFTLCYCWGFTYSGTMSFLKSYNSLDYMSLEGFDFPSDVSNCTPAKLLTKAKTVKLNCCKKLSYATLSSLIKFCPHLETIEMENTGIAGKTFEVTYASNTRTRTLKLSSNKNMSDGALETIVVACPNLEILDLSFCLGISRKGIGKVLRNCRSLRHLRIHGCLGVKNLNLGTSSQKLEVLEAFNSGLDDDVLIDLVKKCPHLMTLDLMNCRNLSSSGVNAVHKNCTSLREINLGCCRKMPLDILPLLVFKLLYLRKIVPPQDRDPTKAEKDLYLKHGCYVKGS